MSEPAAPVRFARRRPDGRAEAVERAVAAEVPVALEYAGVSYAVLMASPGDLADLARGFALAERLIDRAGQLGEVELHHAEAGVIARATLAPDCAGRVAERVRHRLSDSACGLCGVENLQQALRPLPRVAQASAANDEGVFRALAALRDRQPLNAATGAVHAAALCAADGAIRLVREDVGRHNAFDKLIGAMLAAGLGWDGGFALLTSRCSYELVEKAVLAGCPLLATISLPTGLALARAGEAGLALRVLVRADALLAP